MKILLRSEELMLMAVWHLQEEAYCVPIREFLMEATESNWSFGSIYDPLDRLEKRGYLRSFTSDPVQERGGRRKRIYSLTRLGKEALLEMRSFQETLWKTMPELKV